MKPLHHKGRSTRTGQSDAMCVRLGPQKQAAVGLQVQHVSWETPARGRGAGAGAGAPGEPAEPCEERDVG